MYTFDPSPNLSENDHFNLSRHGTVHLDMKFAGALTHTVIVVVCAEFENIIEIDNKKIRYVELDFNN